MKKVNRTIKTLGIGIFFFVCFLLMAPATVHAVDVVGVASTDQKTFTAGEALPGGTVVYIKESDGEVYKADTDLTIPAYGIVIQGSGVTIANGALVNVARKGKIIGESSLTVNGPIYLTATAGTYDQTGVVAYLQPLGVAISAIEIHFDITATYNPVAGSRATVYCYENNNIVSSQAAVAMNTNAGGTVTGIPMPYDGSVLASSALCNSAITSGSVIFDPTVDGTATGLQAILNTTDTTQDYAVQPIDVDIFSAGNLLGVKHTTPAHLTPNTADCRVCVTVEYYRQ